MCAMRRRLITARSVNVSMYNPVAGFRCLRAVFGRRLSDCDHRLGSQRSRERRCAVGRRAERPKEQEGTRVPKFKAAAMQFVNLAIRRIYAALSRHCRHIRMQAPATSCLGDGHAAPCLALYVAAATTSQPGLCLQSTDCSIIVP